MIIDRGFAACAGQTSQTLTHASGVVTSGACYKNNVNCKIQIKPDGATMITLSFTRFNTHLYHLVPSKCSHGQFCKHTRTTIQISACTCCQQQVNVYDGETASETHLLQHSGSDMPLPVFSGGAMLIVFTSPPQSSTPGTGWSAEYTSETGTPAQAAASAKQVKVSVTVFVTRLYTLVYVCTCVGGWGVQMAAYPPPPCDGP